MVEAPPAGLQDILGNIYCGETLVLAASQARNVLKLGFGVWGSGFRAEQSLPH